MSPRVPAHADLSARDGVDAAFLAGGPVDSRNSDVKIEIFDLAEPGGFDLSHSLYEQSWLRPGMVFQHRSMIIACAEKAWRNRQTAIVALVRRDGELETIWPLKIKRELGVTIATDLASPITQYSDVIGRPVPPQLLAELGSQLRRQYGIDVILARNVRSDSGLAMAFGGEDESVVARSVAPFIDLAAFRDYADYVARFSKSSNRNRRQRRQKLEAVHGALTFEVLRGAGSQSMLRIALDWKRGWLDENGLSSRVFDGGVSEAALIDVCADPGVCMSVLRTAQRPLAIEMGFVSGDHYAAYLGAFDPAFAELSVGQEQMLRTIEWCMQQGIRRYDLLPPTADYKIGWARGQPPVPVADHCLALSPVGRVYMLLLRHGKSNARRVLAALPSSIRRNLIRHGKVIVGGALTATAITGLTIAIN